MKLGPLEIKQKSLARCLSDCSDQRCRFIAYQYIRETIVPVVDREYQHRRRRTSPVNCLCDHRLFLIAEAVAQQYKIEIARTESIDRFQCRKRGHHCVSGSAEDFISELKKMSLATCG